MNQPGRSTDRSLIRSPSLSCASRGCARVRASLLKSPNSTQAAPASIAIGAVPFLFAPASDGWSAPAPLAAPITFGDDGAEDGSGSAGPAQLPPPAAAAGALFAAAELPPSAALFASRLAALFAALFAGFVA